MEKRVLGHIDCPTCGTAKGMRITHDKNGDPFGYCEATCSQQMRIGGEKSRVKKFLERFPWAAGSAPVAPVTNTATAPATVKPTEQAKPKPAQAATAPEETPEVKPARRSSLADALSVFGVK